MFLAFGTDLGGKNKVVAEGVRVLKTPLRVFQWPADPVFSLLLKIPGSFLCTFSTLGEGAVEPAVQTAKLEETAPRNGSGWGICCARIE